MQNFGSVDSLSLACSRLRDEVGSAELRKREHEIKTCFLLSHLSPLSGIGIIDNGHNGDFHWGGVGHSAGSRVSSERSLSMQTRWRTQVVV